MNIADTHIFTNTKQEYFPLGEDMHRRLLADLEKAELFIYMEYFIIEEGEFWNSILDTLKRKAASGVGADKAVSCGLRYHCPAYPR